MKQIRLRLQQWLGFSKREANGFLLLTLCMVLTLSSFFWLPSFLPSVRYDPASDKKQLDQMVAVLDSAVVADSVAALADRYTSAATHAGVQVPQKRFAFNPNTISSSQWQQLGLPPFLAERIVRYRDKGGVFRTREDVQKIYGFPPRLYEQLYAYIQLPEKQKFTPYKDTEQTTIAFPKKSKPIAFDLNQADTTQLKTLYGIGSGLSRRILKYREALGGFVHARQVREVYGLDSIVAEEVLKYGHVSDASAIRKIPLNRATVEELKAHPYISATLARVLVAYRQQHGKYTSVASLSGIRILDQTTLQKITPYLSFE